MPRYRFHLYNDIQTQDVDGRLFPNLAAAHADAIQSARAVMASELASKGKITLSHRIEIETEEGDVHIVTFGDAVAIYP